MVDGWRKTILHEYGQRREYSLNPPGAAEQMTGHGFGRANRQFVGMIVKNLFNRPGFSRDRSAVSRCHEH